MIIFNIDIKAVAPDCHPSGEAPLVQASRWWGCSDVDLSTYGDYALAAIDNVIVGVYRINGWMHDPHRDNRVRTRTRRASFRASTPWMDFP